jgi:hypothetical protein
MPPLQRTGWLGHDVSYRDNAHATHPYWGFTAMRRWLVLHRSRTRLYVGF